MFAAAPAEFASAVGLSSVRIGSAAVFAIRAVPLIQFNHAHALGLDAPLDDASLDAIIVALRSRASPVWAVQMPDTAEFSDARKRLAAMNLVAEDGWAKFWRAPVPPKRVVTAFEIREVADDGPADFGRVVQEGFGAPPPFAAWASALVGRPRWRAYVAYDGGAPVAAGALFLKSEIGRAHV